MAFKINIGEKSGKTYKLEALAPGLIDKEIGEKVDGKEIKSELEGYEFEITGASDKSGFPALKEFPGSSLQGALLKYGKGMHKRPKREGKKPQHEPKPKGLRLRKKVRGKVISEDISQINLKVVKPGKKPLLEIFAQEKPAETSAQ